MFIDTNALFPFTVMDVPLTLPEDRLLNRVSTKELLDQWERVIVRECRRSVDSARKIVVTVR